VSRGLSDQLASSSIRSDAIFQSRQVHLSRGYFRFELHCMTKVLARPLGFIADRPQNSALRLRDRQIPSEDYSVPIAEIL